MDISQFFMNGDIKGAIAYMRKHEEFKDILPAYVAIFENGEYRTFDIPDKLNEILRLYQIYYRDTFYCGLPEAEAAEKLLAGLKAHGALPPRLTFALAALIAFYRGERDGESYPVQDDADWISRYQTLWARHRDGQMSTRELVTAVLSVADHWQQDLSQIPGLVELVTADLDAILTCGMRDAVKPLC